MTGTGSAETSIETVDVIVVGAGSGGAVVANRLSADPGTTVLVLEAGRVDSKPEVHIPAAFSKLFRSRDDWNYDTTPQAPLGGRSIYWPRGKVLGGSSSVNAMMWVRGFAADYDDWAAAAGASWSYESILPLLRGIERVEGATDPEHGTEGPLLVSRQRSPRSHTAKFLRAVEEAGFDVVPPNTRAPIGFSQTMVNQRRGARFSAADAYLAPVRSRRNLEVRTEALVTRVLFDGTRAIGVEYSRGGVTREVRARREVVLCGGAVNTPQLLMLSGVGPAAHLAQHGIPVVVDAPEVGANLTDHLLSGLIVEVDGDTLYAAERPREIIDYLVRRRGMLTSNVAEAYGFVRTRPDLALPDIEIIFAPVAFVGQGLDGPPRHGITLGAILLQPESAGTVSLASSDPHAKAIIDPRYLSDSAGKDLASLTAGIALCERILESPALGGTGHRYIMPVGGNELEREERIRVAIEQYAHTLYHPVGTARMGTDAASVVDPELRVRGVHGLRVADASVFPKIIRGHTHAPTLVVGERAADLIARG